MRRTSMAVLLLVAAAAASAPAVAGDGTRVLGRQDNERVAVVGGLVVRDDFQRA